MYFFTMFFAVDTYLESLMPALVGLCISGLKNMFFFFSWFVLGGELVGAPTEPSKKGGLRKNLKA